MGVHGPGREALPDTEPKRFRSWIWEEVTKRKKYYLKGAGMSDDRYYANFKRWILSLRERRYFVIFIGETTHSVGYMSGPGAVVFDNEIKDGQDPQGYFAAFPIGDALELKVVAPSAKGSSSKKKKKKKQ